MLVNISSPQELGLLIRASRKHQKVRMDDFAGNAGVWPVFVRSVERGKETVQLGRVMKLLAELGIRLQADAPEQVISEYQKLKQTGVKPFKPRRSAKSPRSNVSSSAAKISKNSEANE
jgi:transcriptional regulator with XRE-family HTH domain